MKELWVTLACLSGVFAFAFLLGGVVSLMDMVPSKTRLGRLAQLFDGLVLGSLGSLALGLAKNWPNNPEARRLVYAGSVALIATVVFVRLA